MSDLCDPLLENLVTRLVSQSLACPLCGLPLVVDAMFHTPHWYCASGHGYSNVYALVSELTECGRYPHAGSNSPTFANETVGVSSESI